jgi:serine/threonine protein kinase
MNQEDFESKPTVSLDPASLSRSAGLSPEVPGMHIDGYTLISILGEGGFGVVWLADQREPIVRRVAIKIIRP